MPDPLHYREPGLDDPLLRQRRKSRQTVGVGASVLLLSLLVMLLPLLVGSAAQGKYIVAIAFVGVAIGFSIAVNGVIDWRRGK